MAELLMPLGVATRARHNGYVVQAAAIGHTFFGRERELRSLAKSTARVAFIHGIPGISKSALVAERLAAVGEAGGTVLALDCRTVEPTERGFLDAVAEALGVASRLDAISGALASAPAPAVVSLDHYEVFRLMDTWLRGALVPAPERLDFTEDEDVDELAPELAQTFFIGEGDGRAYRVPEGATRLFVGFADGFMYRGAPGWYGNNDGSLRVTVDVST